MKRTYTHIKAFEKELLEMKALGKTSRQIAEHLGLKDLYVVKEWIKRYNRQQRKLSAGILPKRRSRPPKGYVSPDLEKDNEIKQLKRVAYTRPIRP
ncbi:imidazolonepropionase [Phascolarctobacterium faecium]|uniref:imidazolonepropionase n=1 Tax=Phascolarctobacterium faecium TaxID=33025 RepID=UPI003AB33B6C